MFNILHLKFDFFEFEIKFISNSNFSAAFCFIEYCCSSPTYQLASKTKNKSKDKNALKEAPLVDPEPTSDISNFNIPNTTSNNGNISKTDIGNDSTKLSGRIIQNIQSSHGKQNIFFYFCLLIK